MSIRSSFSIESVRFDERGLVPVVAQDIATGRVLMVAWADREALAATLETAEAHFFSRSRGRLWRKGETSGNVLRVREARLDCDQDTVLLQVDASGPACHRGTITCFEGESEAAEAGLDLGWLAQVIRHRWLEEAAGGEEGSTVEKSYTARLLAAGLPRIAQKVGEEAVEVVIAALRSAHSDDSAHSAPDPVVEESADLLYHLAVLWQATGVAPDDVARELRRRHLRRDQEDPDHRGDAS